MEYKNGKIYCIRNSENDEVYIGSTTQPLSKRFYKHKFNFADTKYARMKLYQEMEKLGSEKFYIELIEHYPCTSKEELNKREGEYIRQLGTLNEKVSGRTQAEYKEDNYEYVKLQQQIYRDNNKDYIAEQSKTYRENNKEILSEKKMDYRNTNREELNSKSKKYYDNNKATVLQKSRVYREENKEKIREKKREPITCECGMVLRKDGLKRHHKSNQHQKNIVDNLIKSSQT